MIYDFRFSDVANVVCRIRPEVFNVDNPLQAEGAARGMESRQYRNYVVVQLLSELYVSEGYPSSTPSCAFGLQGVIHVKDLRSYSAHDIGNVTESKIVNQVFVSSSLFILIGLLSRYFPALMFSVMFLIAVIVYSTSSSVWVIVGISRSIIFPCCM